MKAITPVIALVMLLLITTGMVGISYTWFSGMLSANTEKTVIVPAGGIYCSKNRINVVVQNAGTSSNIMDDDVIFADINGVNAKNSLFFGDFDKSGLVGYWRFEQSNGSAATNDSSDYGNMGTLTNMNLTGNATSGPTLGGRFGSALQFDGVNDFVNAGGAASLDAPGLFTVAAWVNLQENKWAYYFGNNLYVVDSGLTLGHHNALSKWMIYYRNAAGTYVANYWGSQVLNQWVHLVVTYDKSLASANWKTYQNGVAKETFDYVGNPMANTGGNANIGRDSGDTRYWNGQIDEVTIWNRALSADEIGQLSRTGSGKFTLGPGQGKVVMSDYPVFQPGKYTVRIGVKNGVAERTVDCQ